MKRKGTLFLVAALLAAMFFNVAPASQASALSTSLVISQVYGGGGNSGATYTHDFIEIFNRGSTAVSLAGLSLQYASATGTGNLGGNSAQLTELPSATLQPGQYYLVQEATGGTNGVPLPTPDGFDATPINMSATGGKVALVNSTVSIGCNGGSTLCSAAQLALIIDLVGWDGANFYETAAAPATSNTTAISRNGGGCVETDNNRADFTVGPPNPRNTATPLSPCVVGDAAPSVVSSTPTNSGANIALDANIHVIFSEPVNVLPASFTLSCSASGVHSFALNGGPTDFILNPDLDFGLLETCTFTVLAGGVADQDIEDPPDNMPADFTAVFTTLGACDLPYTPISNIQGSGTAAAITGIVTTEGVVVGDFETTGVASGFYIQDSTGDSDPATSDGIFVYTGSNNFVSAGQLVRVSGYARERFNQTTLNGSNSNTAVVPTANIVSCGTGSVTPTDVSMPFPELAYPERYEGMLVRLPQSLVISEYFNYDRYGEIVLALPLEGQARAFTPTSVVEPGQPALDLALQNSLRRITLDDAISYQNPVPLRHPNGSAFSLSNKFRGGDLVQNTVGVLGYDFNLYRIFPTGPADYTANNLRPAAPEPVGGNLRLAAMNTLNYFLTLDYPTNDPLDNKCGPLQNVECRGADSDQPLEFQRQRDKLLAALVGLNADVIGLNEMENTPGVEPLADIVAGLNDLTAPGTYAYIDTGVIGTDAIKVGMIYRPAAVTPVGEFKILTTAVDPRFLDTKNRPTLAQTFEENSSGARFTAAVNHLKSKGSDCLDVGDPDLLDGQGNCNVTRTLAAQALVDWLAGDPTGSGDPDYIILGDLNSYAMEDPVDAIKAGPDDMPGTADDYANLIAQFQGAFAYSYVFDGQAGYLDHALANTGMAAQVTGVVDWHINADEPDVLDYDTSFKPTAQDALYEPNAYRSSDHDAVLVGLDLTNLPPTVDADGPYSTGVGAPVLVSASGSDPEGKPLSYAWDLDNDGSFETLGQSTEFVSTIPGIYTIWVQATDIEGLTAVDQTYVAVFDRNGGSVTGGGWIDSVPGAYLLDPLAAGKGEFSFDAKYSKNSAAPAATLTYLIQNSGLYFEGASYDWLVVSGTNAWLHGEGMLNGAVGYSFLLTVTDGSTKLGGDGLDYFRLQVWDLVGGLLVYDSQPGAEETAPASVVLGGGSIVIHR